MKVHRVLPVLDVPVSDVTLEETLEEMAAMIQAGQPDLIATANLDHAMRCRSDLALREALCAARLVTADGMPLVWASRRSAAPLRQRVTGSDLLPRACRMAAERGYRVFLMGGLPGAADRAAARLTHCYPGLRIVGTYCPPFAPLEELDHATMCDAVRRTRPDMLFTSLGSPKGTLWLARHLEALEVPVCLEVGAALGFAAGQARRAPRWLCASGAEWAFRLLQEPGRLGRRYGANALFLLRTLMTEAPACTGGTTRKQHYVGMALPTGGTHSSMGGAKTAALALGGARPTAAQTPLSADIAAFAGDRRRGRRAIRSEDDIWRVTRHVAGRMERQGAVRADLRVAETHRTNLLGALVWLHRHACRKRTELMVHGLPASAEREAHRLGGSPFAHWIASQRVSEIARGNGGPKAGGVNPPAR